MKAKKEAQLITSLIIDDITNSMMISGLERIGLEAGDYHLSVSDIIFKLMGYDEKTDEPVYEGYLALIKKAVKRYVKSDRGKLEQPAKDIYKYLCKNRPN
ncbi:MAG TPA: hypothetical protein VK177_14755 [Flavobacteriales bacterium]|nr:hypothetical protein [Flavobacteriales bacterium]